MTHYDNYSRLSNWKIVLNFRLNWQNVFQTRKITAFLRHALKYAENGGLWLEETPKQSKETMQRGENIEI